MKINEVIERHGMQLRDVSREMGMKPSALQSAIDRNLTVKTLRLISEAARIPIAEFFMDEMPESEELRVKSEEFATAAGAAAQPEQPTHQPSNISHQPSVALQQAIICPHCGHALVMNVVSEKVKSEE